MKLRFNPRRPSLIVIRVEIAGPLGAGFLRMALDTGAVTTLIDPKPLQTLGYGPCDGMPRVRIVTAGDVRDAVQAKVQTVSALGYEKHDFPALISPLPKASGVDGLLGLNYLRERKLTLDFLKGEIIIE